METTSIIILSLICLWILLDTYRSKSRKKWYCKGYVDAAIKYDSSEDPRDIGYVEEASNAFEGDYGFDYD